jgi:phosphoenolpyruvate-protein kinase (PTS system EI component)
MRERRVATQREHELRDRPAMTTDGMRVSVLANAASRGELELALRAGAEGIGLLRSELAFLGASDWPTQREHAEAIEPILGGLENRTAVVRVLDFGVDKSPPFLQDVPERGIELLLRHREAFVSQLRAILLAGQRHEVRILLPMVETVAQLHQSRELLGAEARTLGVERIPQLGSMIETPLAVENAGAIARDSDFLSIGTNDLTASTLGADRFGANSARSHHPLVLRSIARSVAAAHDAGVPIEVCGEAASDPIMLPLLVGLGIDAVSVGAARVGTVRGWIRELSAAEVSGLARSALTMDTAEEVEWAARPLAAEHSLVR